MMTYMYFPDPPDYLPTDSIITIVSGTPSGTSFCISVNVIDDELLEINERFYVILQSLSPSIVTVVGGREVQDVTILDNERKNNL